MELIIIMLEAKISALFLKYRDKEEDVLKIFYHNDFLGKNKFLDVCFIVAQGVVGIYVLAFGYAYLS